MVLAPHPDDESLGCGGLIAQACALGRPPVVTILTDGTGSHPSSLSYPPCRLRDLREREARQAVTTLGLPPDRIHFLGFRDTAAPKSGPDFNCAVSAIVRLMRAYHCRMLCAPWLYEPHGDHEAAQIIARSARTHRQSSVAFLSSMGLDARARRRSTRRASGGVASQHL